MKTKTKKIISAFTAMATVCISLSLTTVAFADENYEDDIYMSSFSDYTSDGLPNGWVAPKYVVDNKKEVENSGSDAHSVAENGNNAVRISTSVSNTIKDIIPFNKLVTSGKLHISFDGKFPRYDDRTLMFVTLFNAYNKGAYPDNNVPISNYEPNDLNDFRGSYGWHTSQFIRVPYIQNGKVQISEACQFWDTLVVTQKTVEANKWYHTDLVIDLDNKVYDVWIDGDKITTDKQGKFLTGSGKDKFKGLAILHANGNTKEGTYDNIFVTNYNNEDSVKLVSEYLNGDDTGLTADVAFSEYLNRAPENGDFVISDSYTGESIDYTVESADGRHAILKINTDKPAKLNIGFNKNSNLKGTISEKLSSKTASVYTNRTSDGSVIPVLNEIKAYEYSGNEVSLNGNQEVPIGTTSIDVSFSEPMSFDDAENKIYLQNIDTSERVKLNYNTSSDRKSVRIDLAELMSPNNNYKFVVENSLASYGNSNVTLPISYEVSFTTAEGSGFGVFGNNIVTDEVAGTAKFVTSIIKSDDLNYKGTIMICGYKDETVDNVTYTKLEKVSLVAYDISDKSITAYETDAIDINGLDRIRCYVNDMNNQKSILFEEKILTNE